MSSSPSRRLRRLTLLAMLAGMVAPAAAQVLPPPPVRAPRVPAPHDPQQRGLSDAVRRAERAGQVLSAEHVQYDGRDVNRVKIVDDRGRVRVYWEDPEAEQDAQDSRSDANSRRRPPRGRTRHDDDDDPTL